MGKLEKEEDSDLADLNTADVELFSGGEGVSDKSPVGSPSVLSRTDFPYAGVGSESEASDSSGETAQL